MKIGSSKLTHMYKSLGACALSGFIVLGSVFGGFTAGEAQAAFVLTSGTNSADDRDWGDWDTDSDIRGDRTSDVTEHVNIHETTLSATHSLTGTISTVDLIDNMEEVEDAGSVYSVAKAAGMLGSVYLPDLESTFTATLVLPAGMSFPSTGTLSSSQYTYNGDSTPYYVESVVVKGQEAVVTFVLDVSELTASTTDTTSSPDTATYLELKYGPTATAGNNGGVESLVNLGELTITIHGISFSDTVSGRRYTALGYTDGTLTSKAELTTLNTTTTRYLGFKWTGVQSADGADAIAPTDTSVITYTYQTPVEVDVTGTKVLNGKTLSDGDYSFTLTNSDGEVVETTTNEADGSITFSTLSFYEPGTYTYTVNEVAGSDENTTYDSNTYTISVVVVQDDEGTLTVSDTSVTTFTATNTYTADPSSVIITGTKTLTGRTLMADAFEFELYDEAGDLVETVTNTAGGAITFSALSFDAAGTYTYTVKEVTGTLTGYTYDTEVDTVVITVVANSDGTLSATLDGEVSFANTYTASVTTDEATSSEATASEATSSDSTTTNTTTRRSSSSGGGSSSSSSRVVTSSTATTTTTTTSETIATPSTPVGVLSVPKTSDGMDMAKYIGILLSSILVLCAMAFGIKKRKQ